MTITLLLIFGTLVTCCFAEKQYKDWDYLVFTQEWPGTFCLYKECNFPSDKVYGWNIHGLWPSSYNGRDPFYCSPAPAFDVDKLQGIYSALRTNWADLLSFYNPTEFWSYEWAKHGTCAIEDSLMPDVLGFFSAGLQMKAKAGLQRSLAGSGIVPSDNYQYNDRMVTDAIWKTLQVTPILRCIHYEGQLYLSAIEICVDKNLKMVDCNDEKPSDQTIARNFVNDILRNTRSSLSIKNPSTPVNRPCRDAPFLLPVINSS